MHQNGADCSIIFNLYCHEPSFVRAKVKNRGLFKKLSPGFNCLGRGSFASPFRKLIGIRLIVNYGEANIPLKYPKR